MPGIKQIISILSDDVRADLIAAGYPDLVDGKILLGKHHQYEQSSPPRIIFIPLTSSFPAKDLADAFGRASAQYNAMANNQSELTEKIKFEVRCWGAGDDQDDDFDLTQALYQQVIRSCIRLTRGVVNFSGGKWTNAQVTSTQLVRDGLEFVFAAEFDTPILSMITPYQNANSAVQPGNTISLTNQSGQTESV